MTTQKQHILDWYQEEAKRTCPDLGSEKLNLAHMVLGIGSETEELYKAMLENDSVGVLEEIIDKIWYLANYCTFRGYSLKELYINKNSFTDEPWEANTEVEIIKFSKLQDYVKKYIAYNKPINSELEINALKGILWSLSEILDQGHLELTKGLKNNIDKLKIRFPEKFQENLALNRDLIAERKELEK